MLAKININTIQREDSALNIPKKMRYLFIVVLAVQMLAENAFAGSLHVEILLQEMTLREKVGQLFCVRPEAVLGSATAVQDGDVEKLQTYPVGGFILFSGNIQSAGQVENLMQNLRASMKIAPCYAVDEEGGSVARIANGSVYDVPDVGSMAKIGRTGDPANARAAAETIGSYLRRIGFHLDFAPVADVNTGASVIGNRAFGKEPQAAAQMVAAAVSGFHDAGVACTLKHFPGHGAASGDTHTGSVSVKKSWEEMLACEIIPFRAGIEAGADAVMAAHILTPNATDDQLPASLSGQMLTRLRNELGFGGLIITDSLSMGAITNHYSAGEAALAAIHAGVDVLLMPESLSQAFDAVLAAAETGTLSTERLDESVRRILNFKVKYGLI